MKVILSHNKLSLIKKCLDYGWHRLKYHDKSGLDFIRHRKNELNKLRKEFK